MENTGDGCLVPGMHYVDGVCLSGFVSDDQINRIKHLELNPNDVLITGYPKSGNIWTQTTVSAILCDDLDQFESKGCPKTFGSIDLDFRWKCLQEASRPTVLLSHLPHHMLPDDVINKNIKVIHIRRNPKDVAVSFYHFSKMLKWIEYRGTWSEYFDLFIKGEMPFGSWFDHTREWLQHTNDSNMLVITYEQFVRDIQGTVCQIAQFLGRTLTPDSVSRIASIMSFNSMKKNPRLNMENMKHFSSNGHFLRKGQIGDWKNYFTAEQNVIFDRIYNEFQKETGLDLQFE